MDEYDQVMRAYGPALARVAAGYERDPVLRAELAQEIAVAVWQALPRLKDRERLKPFLFRVAHNRAVSHVIRRANRPVMDGDLAAVACDRPDP